MVSEVSGIGPKPQVRPLTSKPHASIETPTSKAIEKTTQMDTMATEIQQGLKLASSIRTRIEAAYRELTGD